MNKITNPIYKEYYVHDNCECYKIDLPYTKYDKDTIVLCKVSKGYEHAKQLARGVLVEHVIKRTEKEI